MSSVLWQVKPRLDAVTLKFGAVYTDHMLQVSWKDGVGWTVPSIDPLGPLTLHPCAQVMYTHSLLMLYLSLLGGS